VGDHRVALGARQHAVLENGGSGYFPIRLVRPHLHSGKLALISGGPDFVLSAYVVYPIDAGRDAIAPALEVIREAAAVEGLSTTKID
jgi:hypothetical protein